MHSSSRSRNAAPSVVSSSSRLAVADEGIASRWTWFAKGRPDSANGLSVIGFPQRRIIPVIGGCACEGGGGELVMRF